MAVGQFCILFETEITGRTEIELHLLRCLMDQDTQKKALQKFVQSAAGASADQKMRNVRKFMHDAVAVDVHAYGQRKTLGGLVFAACKKIAQKDLVALPGDVDIDPARAAIDFEVSSKKDSLICGFKLDDTARAPHIRGLYAKACHHRPLNAHIQGALYVILSPEVDQIVNIRHECLVIPSRMIFEDFPCLGKNKNCHALLLKKSAVRRRRTDIWIISCLRRAWYNYKC